MIDRKTVEHVARLARLRLTEEEIRLFAQQLAKVLEHVEKVSRLNLEGVEPTSHALGMTNVWREDEPRPPAASPEDLLKISPDRWENFFRVPKVLE